jgi:23S rRNA pseudouridine2605 synthase
MRINSYLAKSGLSSRRKVEAFVTSGRVTINGKKAILSDRVLEGDEVYFDNKKVELKDKKYFLVYKPVGYTSTVEDIHAEKKVVDLITDEEGLFPVGRLDKDSEGLIILTNDGDFAQELTHPSHEHEKEYLVSVKLPQKNRTKKLEDALKFFKCGIRLDDKKTQPAKISLISQDGDEARFNIILTEGMKRQIRRTFEKAGLNVIKLKRTRISSYLIDDLMPGDYKEFKPDL